MKRILLTLCMLPLFFTSCDTLSSLPGSYGGYTEAEAAQGIRQALDQGIDKGISFLNKPDGFFGN